MSDITEIEVGQDLYWLRGDCHMIATVLVIDGDRVKVAGLTKDYWIRKQVLLDNVNRMYPGTNSMYCPNG